MSAAALELPGTSTFPRLLAGLDVKRTLRFDDHLARYGGLDIRRGLLSAELAASGLTGRGGAGFPVAAKVGAVAARRGRPVVVVNAAEGEPLSGKDKVLLRHLPHLVVDGGVALAHELGARDVFIVHSAADRREGVALRAALAERAERRVDRSFRISAVDLPEGFVSGQETAIVRYLNGGPAAPTFTPPRPFESGVGKRPTLVQNAETAAHVALIARHGADWFREAGTSTEPGTALFTVSGSVARPGVYELPLGTALSSLVGAAGGATARPRAFLIGGYAGTWLDAVVAAGLRLDEASLRACGGTLGVGAVAVLPQGACGLCETARVARYLAGQSAGQCGPCVHGLHAVASALERPLRSGPGADRAALSRWLGQVGGRGACRHPDGTARFVASALRVFDEEWAGHEPGRCRKGARQLLPTPDGSTR